MTSHTWSFVGGTAPKHNGYWMYSAPQMGPDWFPARRYRINGGSWYDVVNNRLGPDFVDKVCGDNIIVVVPGSSYGIDNEDTARQAYLAENHVAADNWFIPGLCIPGSAGQLHSWIPVEERFLLAHVSGSADLVLHRPCLRVIELKCPITGKIYPDALRGRARPNHYTQVQANTGIMGAERCDYFVWTPTKTKCVSMTFYERHYRTALKAVLDVLKKDIIQHVDLKKFILPDALYETYARDRDIFLDSRE